MAEVVRVPRRSTQRRLAVLTAARLLFSDHGIAGVTTNQIAQAAGVSPGNLYYWFPSKTAIVHELFEQWSASEALEEGAESPAEVLRMLWARSVETNPADSPYSFFLRDLFPLLHSDPVLARRYRESYHTRVRRYVGLLEELHRVGLVHRPSPPADFGDLVSVLWLVSETHAPFGEIVEDRLEPQRIAHLMLESLLTTEGRDVLHLGKEPTRDHD